jgi:hypothetical protein
MTVTEEVVRDLLPLYFENEASVGSRALVETWFVRDPAFARTARHGADAVAALGDLETPPLDETGVREALKRARRIVFAREVSLGLAGALTLLPFLLGGFAWLSSAPMPVAPLDGLFALIVCFSLAATSWLIYFYVRRRTGSDLF